jgi:hypothetical protein
VGESRLQIWSGVSSLFLQRVLVALDTGRGVIYAPASGWDRVYLMWTFRNFHSLPQTVLNPRQQQLIGSLYRAATNHPAEELHEAAVVGTVEGFNPSALSALPNSSRARTLDPVGSAEVTAPDQGQPFHARFALNRMTLRVGAAALVAIIAILAWLELGAQPISNSELERIPPSARQSGNPIAMAKDLSPTTGPLSGSFASQPSPVRIADPGPITEPPAGAIATTETTAIRHPKLLARPANTKQSGVLPAFNSQSQLRLVCTKPRPISPGCISRAVPGSWCIRSALAPTPGARFPCRLR